MDRSRTFTAAAAAVLATAASATGAAAQTVWTTPPANASVELEVLRPSFSSELDFSFATAAGFVTARVPLNETWKVVADLPFSRAGWSEEGVSASASRLGNPYVGVEWANSARFTTELGFRVPVGELDELDDIAPMLVGVAGELDRMEAFVPGTLGAYAVTSYRAPVADNLTLRLRGGPSFLGGDGGPDDLFLGYTGQIWYTGDRFGFGSGLTGRANLTTDDQDADRTAHQAVIAGDYRFGRIRPGLQVRLPLDGDSRDVSGSTISVSVGYAFR